MAPEDAISFLIERFPILRARVEHPDDLLTGPHFVYSLLATEILEHSTDNFLLKEAADFINDLADSGDDLLEELLVVDVLEGIAQNPELLKAIRIKLNRKATMWLDRVEDEFFGRTAKH